MIVGGRNEDSLTITNDVLIYNIDSNSYGTNKPKLPYPVDQAAIVKKENYIYVFGGRNKDETIKKVARIELKFQSGWEELPEMKTESKNMPVLAYN